MFPSPKEFNPVRYLNVDKSDLNAPSTTFFFGFGRRICPGRHVALNSLFILVSRYVMMHHKAQVVCIEQYNVHNLTRILWAFDIVGTKDGKGGLKIPHVDDIEGTFALSPRPFTFLLEPRKDVPILIEEEFSKAKFEASRWM